MPSTCFLYDPKFWSSWSHLQKDILFIVADIEEQVVSVILDLASPDSMDDYRTEAVAVSYFWENRIIPIIFIVHCTGLYISTDTA